MFDLGRCNIPVDEVFFRVGVGRAFVPEPRGAFQLQARILEGRIRVRPEIVTKTHHLCHIGMVFGEHVVVYNSTTIDDPVEVEAPRDSVLASIQIPKRLGRPRADDMTTLSR